MAFVLPLRHSGRNLCLDAGSIFILEAGWNKSRNDFVAGRCGSSCLVSASLTVSLKRNVCKKRSWKWKLGCNLKRTGSNLWVVSVNTIPFRFYQDAPLALLNLNVGKTHEMKKLSTGNTGQNPPGLLKHFTGFWMSDVYFLKPYRTYIQPRCSTIGPSHPKQDVPWHQLDPKWDPENRWECASSIQTNPLNSLVNQGIPTLQGGFICGFNRNPDLFFQQKPGAMLSFLILWNEWGFLGPPNFLLKFSSFLKMLKSFRWWILRAHIILVNHF